MFFNLQCDQIGRFLEFLGNKFYYKVAQMLVDFLGICEKHCFFSQTGQATFWATFGKTWATFYFNIWSHCFQRPLPFHLHCFKCHKNLSNFLATISPWYKMRTNNRASWSGSGCGAVGRAITSTTRYLQFESSHWQNLYVLLTALKIGK